MTGISLSGSKEHFTGEYADPSTCTYYAYECTYCQKYFYLVRPNDFQADVATRTVQYRNPDTNEIKARENRSEDICLSCFKEIMRRQQRRW
jgi:hypothetical protein